MLCEVKSTASVKSYSIIILSDGNNSTTVAPGEIYSICCLSVERYSTTVFHWRLCQMKSSILRCLCNKQCAGLSKVFDKGAA